MGAFTSPPKNSITPPKQSLGKSLRRIAVLRSQKKFKEVKELARSLKSEHTVSEIAGYTGETTQAVYRLLSCGKNQRSKKEYVKKLTCLDKEEVIRIYNDDEVTYSLPDMKYAGLRFMQFMHLCSESDTKPNDKNRDVQPNKDTNSKSDVHPKKHKCAKKKHDEQPKEDTSIQKRDVQPNEDTNSKSDAKKKCDEQPNKDVKSDNEETNKCKKGEKGAVDSHEPDVPAENEQEKIDAKKRKHDNSNADTAGDSDEPIILKRQHTTDISLRRSARVQQKKNQVKALVKEAKDKYTKKVASPFILAESSVTYCPPPEGFYGSFGAKEKNVRPDPVHLDDDWDDAGGGETSSSCEIVKIKKPKKGFIENEVVFTDDEMDIDSTLKNNIGENLEKV